MTMRRNVSKRQAIVIDAAFVWRPHYDAETVEKLTFQRATERILIVLSRKRIRNKRERQKFPAIHIVKTVQSEKVCRNRDVETLPNNQPIC